ncbi:hypothetical protein N781_05740 [Pontibacillus halophilus JSM 076056 = DSM 19796]|uniref:DUF2759 domain-containing protein n=1 Tax=Pontibacillus halophilus JSM 076056 = DSM 19796 TaxID=1385510 RepID=A0A0A5GFT0_9BACI|nr:DUF2759 family protein [Pontibacillus halophilus]KGX90874.1 hypothetical protein N781_05740 [Pontibacillus halophilus JSM 076056 = DSM 19796]
MVLAIMLFAVTLLCLWAVVREVKRKNLFAVAFSFVCALVFGFFSIATIVKELKDMI